MKEQTNQNAIAYCYECASTILGEPAEYEKTVEAHLASHCLRDCCTPPKVYPLCECGQTVRLAGVGYWSEEGWVCKSCHEVHTRHRPSVVKFSGLAQLLEQARSVIATPATWCQGASARSMSGEADDWASASAVQWCGTAALSKARDAYGFRTGDRVRLVILTDNALDALQRALPGDWESVQSFNDYHETTHADMLAVYDRAIEATEREAERRASKTTSSVKAFSASALASAAIQIE